MMTACTNATYREAVNIAIASEEKNSLQKEAKKKKNVSFGSSGSNQKYQRVIYHPVNHSRPSFRPPQFQAWQQSFVRPVTALPYPQQPNAPGIRTPTPQGNNYPCYNCEKLGHFSRECPYLK
jgi:hypothetical protein